MVTILNKRNQPITVNLGNGKSIHFLAKQSKVITFEEFQCQEMKEKIENAHLIVLRMDNDS